MDSEADRLVHDEDTYMHPLNDHSSLVHKWNNGNKMNLCPGHSWHNQICKGATEGVRSHGAWPGRHFLLLHNLGRSSTQRVIKPPRREQKKHQKCILVCPIKPHSPLKKKRVKIINVGTLALVSWSLCFRQSGWFASCRLFFPGQQVTWRQPPYGN